jgi:hypothetical protein
LTRTKRVKKGKNIKRFSSPKHRQLVGVVLAKQIGEFGRLSESGTAVSVFWGRYQYKKSEELLIVIYLHLLFNQRVALAFYYHSPWKTL